MADGDVPLGRHLEALGLSSKNPLTLRALRAAYHVKAKRHHPDRAGPRSHDAFVKLQAAYEAALSFCTGSKPSHISQPSSSSTTCGARTNAAPSSASTPCEARTDAVPPEDVPPPGVSKWEWRRAREIWEKPATPASPFREKPGTPGWRAREMWEKPATPASRSREKPGTPGSPSREVFPPSPKRPPSSPIRPPSFAPPCAPCGAPPQEPFHWSAPPSDFDGGLGPPSAPPPPTMFNRSNFDGGLGIPLAPPPAAMFSRIMPAGVVEDANDNSICTPYEEPRETDNSICTPYGEPRQVVGGSLAEDQAMRAVERMFDRERKERQAKQQMQAASRAYFRRNFSMPRASTSRPKKSLATTT